MANRKQLKINEVEHAELEDVTRELNALNQAQMYLSQRSASIARIIEARVGIEAGSLGRRYQIDGMDIVDAEAEGAEQQS